MSINACKDCQKRHVGCHSTCEDFKEWRQKKDEENAKKRARIQKHFDGIYHK